jgi:hypothetical protein
MAPRIVLCIVCTLGADPHGGCINTPNPVIVCYSRHLTTRKYRNPLPAAGDAVTDGKPTGSFANATSKAMMPTVCRIITTAQYYNVSNVAISSNSSDCAVIVPRVSLVLVSMNSLIK